VKEREKGMKGGRKDFLQQPKFFYPWNPSLFYFHHLIQAFSSQIRKDFCHIQFAVDGESYITNRGMGWGEYCGKVLERIFVRCKGLDYRLLVVSTIFTVELLPYLPYQCFIMCIDLNFSICKGKNKRKS
jgi:hypothetical protein